MMKGKLYAIGVGPGDPELLTLKAVRLLREAPCICVPKGREAGSSLALSIVKNVLPLDGKEILESYFPMKRTKSHGLRITGQELDDHELDSKWHETIESILSRLNKGMDMAFITLGDPTIYSTFFYLYDRLLELDPELNIEIVPGVSSVNAAASRAKVSLSLADERIAVLPANYAADLKEAFESFDTVVLMKVNTAFERILKTLDNMNLIENAVCISKAGMEDERIFRNIRDVKEKDLNYFSIIIVRR